MVQVVLLGYHMCISSFTYSKHYYSTLVHNIIFEHVGHVP
jgi:hypothetical protein